MTDATPQWVRLKVWHVVWYPLEHLDDAYAAHCHKTIRGPEHGTPRPQGDALCQVCLDYLVGWRQHTGYRNHCGQKDVTEA